MKPQSFEEVLEQVGSYGTFQRRLLYLFVVPINFFIPWLVLAPIFLTSTEHLHCTAPPHPGVSHPGPSYPGLPRSGLSGDLGGSPGFLASDEIWLRAAIPRNDEGVLEGCKQYNMTWRDVVEWQDKRWQDGETWQDEDVWKTANVTGGDVGAAQIDCQHGHTAPHTSIPLALGWVCGREHLAATWLSVGLAGNVVGTVVFTNVADILGRKHAITATAIVAALFGSLRALSRSTAAAMSSHFLASMAFPANIAVSYILGVEQMAGNTRSLLMMATFISWTAGMSVLPLLAWATTDWRVMCLYTSLPFLAFAASHWLLPESPSWVLSRGRVGDAAELLRGIARVNKLPEPHDLAGQLQFLVGEESKHLGAVQLLATPVNRKRTLLLSAAYSCNNLLYYSITYNLGNMGGNSFLNFFLFAIIEFPANFLGYWLVEVIGRRWAHVLAFVVAIFCILISIPLQVVWWASSISLTVAKLFSTVSFLVVLLQAAELYPTSHRGSGTGLSSIVSGVVGIAAPYVAYTDRYWSGLPCVIMAAVGLAGVLVASFLPETIGQDLPQTLQDSENFLVDQPYFSFVGRRRNRVKKTDKAAVSSEASMVTTLPVHLKP